MEERYFKIIANTRYDHNFAIGQVVRYVKTFPDGVHVLEGGFMGGSHLVEQDIHPNDCVEIKNPPTRAGKLERIFQEENQR